MFSLNKGTGHLKPDETSCSAVKIPGNKYETTFELVDRTIAILNLNCDRLAEKRITLVRDIERNKKRMRQKGVPSSEMPNKFADRYFAEEWPEFFTTLRCCLGAVAEDYLKSIDYQG